MMVHGTLGGLQQNGVQQVQQPDSLNRMYGAAGGNTDSCLGYPVVPETRETRYLSIYRKALNANDLSLALDALRALDEKAGQ